MSRITRFPPLLLVVLAVAVTGYGLFKLFRVWESGPVAPGSPPDKQIHATVLPVGPSLPPVNLIDHQGAPFTLANLKSRWSYLFFGYTQCPDVCQPTLLVMNQLNQLQEALPASVRPQMVFVSIDPARDTQEVLNEYLSRFDRPIIGVTGTLAALRALTGPLGIFFQQNPESFPDGYYKMDHSMAVLLIDPEGRLRAISSTPHDAFVMAKDFSRILLLGG